MQSQAMSQETGRRREVMLKMIERALGRLDGNKFGICQNCAEPIARKRLEFDPAAELCIECASEIEQADDRT